MKYMIPVCVQSSFLNLKNNIMQEDKGMNGYKNVYLGLNWG